MSHFRKSVNPQSYSAPFKMIFYVVEFPSLVVREPHFFHPNSPINKFFVRINIIDNLFWGVSKLKGLKIKWGQN